MSENSGFGDCSIVVATYNELPNLKSLIERLLEVLPGANIIIVDDNSPDGSPELLRSMAQSIPLLHPLIRPGKSGYGSAVSAGLTAALEIGSTRIATLDADFSHDPAELPAMFAALENADVAIGSRYFNGVRVLNWHPSRLVLSLFANRYVKAVVGLPVHDATSGFRAYRSSAVEIIRRSSIRSVGYSYLVEILTLLVRTNQRIVEVPIIYTERREGQSKMTGSVIFEAALRPWVLRYRRFK
jgi:dolichol-phosphate mannosyltransferase